MNYDYMGFGGKKTTSITEMLLLVPKKYSGLKQLENLAV